LFILKNAETFFGHDADQLAQKLFFKNFSKIPISNYFNNHTGLSFILICRILAGWYNLKI